MPNWCSSGIVFYSENEKSLANLQRKLNEIYEGKPTPDNAFGKGCMRDYANTFFPNIGAAQIECKGFVSYIGKIEPRENIFAFLICTQTAWTAKVGLWHRIIKDFYPDIKMAYVAEEYGSSYYCKWDETGLFFDYDYYVDIEYPGDDEEVLCIEDHEFISMESIYKWLDFHLPFKYEKKDDIDELEKEINSKLDEYSPNKFYCSMAKYNNIPPSEFKF